MVAKPSFPITLPGTKVRSGEGAGLPVTIVLPVLLNMLLLVSGAISGQPSIIDFDKILHRGISILTVLEWS